MTRLLIQFSHFFKSFASHSLFEDISLSINRGDLLAIVGENGAGKTTLLQLLAGNLKPDSGHFSKAADLSIGFLPQEIVIADPSISVRAYIESADLTDLEKQMTLYLESDQLIKWAELHANYEALGGYRRAPVEKVLEGLKLDSSLLELPMANLSSGQKVRTALAKALIDNPALLLLDEPTNHLDQEMVQWLKAILHQREGASVIVSHDRAFLNSTCNRLVEIKNGRLISYGGNYDFYLNEQERLLERQLKAYESQEEERSLLKQKIKSLTFSKKKANPAKDRNIMCYDARGEYHQKSLQHNLDGLKARLAKIEANLLPHPIPKGIKGLRFNPAQLSVSVVIELDKATKSYGNKVLFSGFSKIISNGDRIIVNGANGAGKTTLLRCIAGLTALDGGKIKWAQNAKVAYLDQEGELLPMDKTALEYFEEQFNLNEEEVRRELHKAALGGADLLRRPLSTLSAGQRKRLSLLSLILARPNVLLLDEPTNHLDLKTLEAFERALLDFEGAILAVSHDATFIDKIATETWEL
ncbi:ABC transporter, ATPase subunit [Candidatus Protochlamydia naegleriophila]|uniref:ABC transporter, ATPase subunit n=1 Tax=Candidatus Protochlamydia naegleriophila TaxID=389348 RepID=A0A0U5EUN6_9BACT|nr:ABC-F family ATP-binding cassette domain-containing protein [Candidatus Protochlamydia naegleriophila]CUI17968.1 ABC transporter, ATPase subunit [Candidatus Protochlamydia naegleriophila]